MISDADWRRLAEIEMALRRDDPAFVQRFDPQRVTSPRRRMGTRLAILLVLAVTALVIGLGCAAAALVGPSAMGGLRSPAVHEEVPHDH